MTLQPVKPTEEILEGDGQVVYRLLGRRSSQKLLQNVPCIPYLDMVIVFYLLVTFPDYGPMFLLITDRQMKEMQVTTKELYRQAQLNTQELLPAEFKSMQEIFQENFPFLTTRDGEGLYVLTNQERSFGAAAILYDGQLDAIGRELEEDFYVIPSSIHETLIMPASQAPGPEVTRMIIRHINESIVRDTEILSDDVYFYERSLGTLRKCL